MADLVGFIGVLLRARGYVQDTVEAIQGLGCLILEKNALFT